MDNILLISLCIIPSLIILWYVYIKDKVEKEPLYLLFILFIGGIISCAISILISMISKKYILFLNYDYINMNIFQIIYKILFSIVIVEELSKWIINYITIWRNKKFDHIYDPIVYCTFVSLGFATLENIIYGITYSSHGFIPILLRGVISVPSHAVFGIFMGYYLGISKNALMYNKNKQSNKYKLLSILFPIMLHFIYDLLLINNNTITYIIFIIYIIILYILAYFKIRKLSSVHEKLKQKDIS